MTKQVIVSTQRGEAAHLERQPISPPGLALQRTVARRLRGETCAIIDHRKESQGFAPGSAG